MKCKLKEVCSYIARGITPKYSDNSNFYVINQKCIRDNTVSFVNSRQHNYTERKVSADKILHLYDILVNSTGVGTAGRVAQLKLIPDNYLGITADSHVTIVRPDPKQIYPEYLGYFLQYKQPYIESLAKGSTGQTEISRSSITSTEIDLPDLENQKKIVKILSILDQKIELNNNENNTLQSIIDTQYRKVFSGNKSNNKVKASDLFDYEGGYSYTSAELADESNIGMMTIKNFERTGGFKVDGFKALNPKKGITKTAALYDIFISCTDVTQNADIIGNAIMLLDTDRYSTVTYSMDLVRIIPKINRFTLYAILSSKDFKNYALGYKSGTTVLHLNKKCLAEYEIPLPDEKSLEVFGATIEKACKKIAINLTENRCLSQIRDSLLPKLMSGDINLNKVMNE